MLQPLFPHCTRLLETCHINASPLTVYGGGQEDRDRYQQTNNSTSQHLQARQSSLISSVIRLQDRVGQWNAADAMDLDFTRALNQIAHDILVDNMEECAMHLFE